MKSFCMERDGFFGTLYQPEGEKFSGKAVVVFGGSDGDFSMSCQVAECFWERGLTVLALAYWKQPGLPDEFRKIPVEPLERAALWLHRSGYEKVGLWGISKGAELALLAGSLMPDLFSCAAAVSPTNVACQGISKKRGVRLLPCSSWSWRGREIPYAPLKLGLGKILGDSLRGREITLTSAYAEAVKQPPEEAVIPVEKIRGPVLLLSAKRDSTWPSAEAAERIMKRLEAKKEPRTPAYSHRHLSYEYASHLLAPVPVKLARAYAVERRFPAQCAKAREDSLQQTLAFFQAW